jgi:4-hydroxyphenylpyruvate dioxygenase
MGFTPYAYSGLETGNREWTSTVVKNGKVMIVLSTPVTVNNEFKDHIDKHGDGVREIAFTVEDATKVYDAAVSKGAKSICKPTKYEDKNGFVILSSVLSYGDTIHTFVQRNKFEGFFLPDYIAIEKDDPLNEIMGKVSLGFIDHIVGNHEVGGMETSVQWYEKMLNFHRFWSIDDSIIHTEYSALNSIVVADFDEVVKMPQNEPANGKRKSQIQEYVDYYNGSGVQHVALNVDNIIEVITNLRKRGLEFLTIPKAYYENLRKRLQHSSTKIKEDIDVLEKLHILVDYDDQGYLLQIFTRCVQDRPTLFYEFIQRNNHNGFGAGNFKSLFEAIEREQEMRGNLY